MLKDSVELCESGTHFLFCGVIQRIAEVQVDVLRQQAGDHPQNGVGLFVHRGVDDFGPALQPCGVQVLKEGFTQLVPSALFSAPIPAISR